MQGRTLAPTTHRRHRHSCPPRFGPARGGFSLVELVVVLVIVAMLAAIAAPRFANSLANSRAAAAAQRVAADLALARTVAMAASKGVPVAFTVATASYTAAGVVRMDNRTGTYAVSLAGEPYGAKIVSATFGNGSQVTFDMYGNPDNGGSVVIAVGSVQKTVTLDPNSGLTSIQ